MVNPVLASASISVVEPQRSGMASGANNTFRQVGIATGIAVLGAVFQSQIVSHTSAVLEPDRRRPRGDPQGRQPARWPPWSAGGVHAGGGEDPAAGGTRPRSCDAYHIGFSTTLNHITIIAAIIAFVGVVGRVLLVRQRDFVDSRAGQAAAGGGHA